MTPELIDCWRFKYDKLAGHIIGGHEHGFELTAGASMEPVSRRMCMNLEHYYARGRTGGRFVPRYKAEVTAIRAGDDAIQISIEPYEDWRITSVIAYRLLPECTLEATYEFTFHEDYGGFEALISNYFHEPTEPYLHAGGKWFRPQLGDREHRFWVRTDEDTQVLKDGRWDDFYAEMKDDYTLSFGDAPYDYPLMVTEIGDAGWSIVHVIEKGACPSVSANRTWNAHDFSLVGRDVAEGETVTCRAWMAYRKLESLDDALTLCKDLLAER